MTDTELICSLRRLKVETGSLVCWGGGHEHNCGIHGCAIIRQAAERLEELRQEKALRWTEGTKKI
jgi:hypothetical protein